MSLTSDFFNGMEKRKKKKYDYDVAPVRTNTTLAGDDIAPVRTKTTAEKLLAPTVINTPVVAPEKEWYDKIVKKPELFNDGYQAGDVAKTILGTTADFSLGVLTGVGNFAEGIGDTINYGIADIFERANNKDFANALREETKKSLVQKLLGETTETVDKWSVLGDTSDSVAQGLGMITTLGAGGMALGGAGVGLAGQTALTTGGTLFSGVGSGMSEAYEGGATDEEARTYGLISGTADALSELIFGGLGKGINAVGFGKGLSSADDMLAKKVSDLFSNQIAKNLAQYGIKSGAEGFEEVLSGVAQGIGKKITYMSDKELGEILNDESLLEQFVVGAVTSGFAQAGDFYKATKTGTDFVTGLTENEQKVIDKEVENRIAESETDGTKLTKKQKEKIKEDVLKDLDKGYISIDTIESALGGETYNNYTTVTKQEDAIINEYNELGNKPNLTEFEKRRFAELEKQVEEIKNNSQKDTIKSKLGDEVFNLAKGSRLAESYNEKARRGQTFEADLSKYDTKQQDVIKKAVESGVLNNTNRTHEFVDMIAKISADKGVSFDFTNNEKLKTSGFAVDGKTVNGFVDGEGNITLNANSSKWINSVVGHEITHILEGTELYSALQEAVKQYATTKGEYAERMQSLRELYTGVYKGKDFDLKLQSELTADIIGDYLFSDSNFINSLSTEQPNLFKKIYNEVKYLCKVATAGSKEARELEKVKKAFDNAWKESGKAQKNTTDKGDVKYSISESVFDTEGNQYNNVVKVNTDIFKGYKPRNWKTPLKEFVDNNLIGKKITIFNEEGKSKTIEFAKPNDRIVSETGNKRKVIDKLKQKNDRNSQIAVANIENLVEVSFEDNSVPHSEENRHQWLDAKGWDYRFAYIEMPNGKLYSVQLNIANAADGRYILYDINKISELGIDSMLVDEKSTASQNSKFAENSLPQNFEKSSENQQFSLDLEGIKTKYKDKTDYLFLHERNDTISISNMIVKKEYRNQGIGTQILNDIVAYADENGKTITLTPTTEFGTQNKLKKWYKANGFVENKGRNADLRLSDTMYRLPKKGNSEKSQPQKQFSLSNSVEETKELVAVHGMTIQNLTSSLELGGLPMPSIAIIKARMGHNKYGDVSLVFGKETIDPELNNENKVYGLDVWSPVYPTIEFKVNKAVASKIRDKYYELGKKYGYDDVRPLYAYAEELERQLNNAKGEQGLLEDLYNDVGLMKVYLLDSGKSKVEPVMKEERTALSDMDVESIEYLIDAIGRDVIDEFVLPEGVRGPWAQEHRKEFWDKHLDEVQKAYGNMFIELDNFTEEDAKKIVDNTSRFELNNWLKKIVSYIKNGKEQIKFTEDRVATEEAIKKAAQDGYVEWVDNLFKGVAEKSGIRNNVDYFDKYGNRRDWEALHYANKLENVVKVMKGQENGNSFFNAGALWAIAAKDYGTIQEIKADSDRLKLLSEDEYSALKQGIGERVDEIADSLNSKYSDSNYFIDHDNKINNLFDAIKSSKTKSGVLKYLNQYFTNATEDTVTDLLNVIADAGNLPTEYFEAKPQRAVMFDEVKAVIIPDNAPQELREQLDSMGLNVLTYEHGNDNSRTEVLNSIEDVKFSLSKEGEHPTRDYRYGNLYISGDDVRYQPTEDIAPTVSDVEKVAPVGVAKNTTTTFDDIAPMTEAEANTMRNDIPVDDGEIAPPVKSSKGNGDIEQPIAKILAKEPEVKKKSKLWSKIKTNFIDKASPFETLALKTGNREVDAKFNSIRYSDSKAQMLIGEGANGVKSLNDIQAKVEQDGLTQSLYEYLYHKHNVDRMTLEDRYDDVPNKSVFGNSMTAELSQKIVDKYESENPKLIEYANDIYTYNKYLRNLLVEGGVISKETADLWEEMYPHYVPIRRIDSSGLNVNVPLDSRKTGINAPVKRAKGGNTDILPLFDTMAQRTLQTYKAVAKNRFGIELKNTLDSTVEKSETSLDEIIESIDTQDDLLKKGKYGKNPTFTVFENGEKVTFEITDEMYDAMKPTSEGLSNDIEFKIPEKLRNKIDKTGKKMPETIKPLNALSSLQRGVLTEYNPTFMLTNAIKDAQDVFINSQHPARTYKNFPKAIKELTTKGKLYTEYMQNGGADNTYFDKQTNSFNKEKSGLSKAIGFPLEKISEANNFIERIPRLAEYIASRESGRSIDVSMLDAARVTTNFSAGGDVTKFLNRNGATFLNASVQGAAQQVRNIREAKVNGLKGWVQLATKVALAGLPALFLNGLLWDDDEEYEELSDYVKQNYYVVAKMQDGKFVRIPKGRAMAVIQEAFTQIQNALTGDDEVDLQNFLELAVSNLAPNNPLDNNIIAPIKQVIDNKTWYGEDLVPTRLQDVPDAEQYDENTDAISKWLGEKLNYSPYKINYLLDQYSGGLGDVVLPMLTPKAESGDNSMIGFLGAPMRDKFSTDSVFNNQNTADFYNVSDELKVNANSSDATDEDVLKSKYFNSISTEISDLYKEKREIQNSNLSDAVKYKQVRDIQEQINQITENALNTYENVKINGSYANIGDRHYRLNDDGEWQKITDEQLEKQNEVIGILGITPSQYWGNKAEYDMKAFYPEKYKVLQEQGISVEDYKENYEKSAFLYTDDYSWAANNPGKYTLSKVITDDVMEYRQYTTDLYNIKADKDSNGKSISGSRKKKVVAYINSLDIDDGAKYVLWKSQYPADKTYNKAIFEYINGRSDITRDEKITILEELGAKVDSNGNVRW